MSEKTTTDRHLGHRIPWEALPEECKKAVVQDLSAVTT